MRITRFAVVVYIASLVGCAARVVEVPSMDLNRISAPYPEKIETPLYLAAAPDGVAASYRTNAVGGLLFKQTFDIRGVETFVSRDLAKHCRQWFSDVRVLGPGESPKGDSYIVATVRIAGITLEDAQREVDPPGTVRPVLDWTVSFRRAGDEQPFHEYGDKVATNGSDDANRATQNMLEAAMIGFGTEVQTHVVPRLWQMAAEASTAESP